MYAFYYHVILASGRKPGAGFTDSTACENEWNIQSHNADILSREPLGLAMLMLIPVNTSAPNL